MMTVHLVIRAPPSGPVDVACARIWLDIAYTGMASRRCASVDGGLDWACGKMTDHTCHIYVDAPYSRGTYSLWAIFNMESIVQ